MALKDELKKQLPKRPRARAPISGRNVLTMREEDKDPNYEYRVVNDVGSRVEIFKERGYEVVTGDVALGDRRAAVAGKEGTPVQAHVGDGMKAVLMRIPKEYKEEDDRAKQEYVDSLEASLKRQPAADYGDVKIEKGT